MIYRNFLHQLSIENADGHFAYALCTAGDDIGRTIDILQEDLSEHGMKLSNAWSLVMPETYVGLPFMDVDTPEKTRQKIATSQQRLNNIIPDIVARKSGYMTKLDIGTMARMKSGIVADVFNRFWVSDKRFSVDRARCLHCRICEKVCPTSDITCDNDPHTPQWKHNGSCMTCLNCYHHCPAHAISFAGQTKNKGQYYFKKNI